MATQTVTVTHAPASPAAGHSHSTVLAAQGSAASYSLSDMDILDAADASSTEPPVGSADQVATPTGARGQGTSRDESPEGAALPSSGQASSAPATDPRGAPADFEPAFALPGIGAKLREICERDATYRAIFPDAGAARAASAAQAQLASLDRLVESRDPRAHGELLASLQRSAPEAFRALAITFAERLATLDPVAYQLVSAHLANGTPGGVGARHAVPSSASSLPSPSSLSSSPVQPPDAAAPAAANQFLEAVNADVESSVRESVAGRVDELLPEAPEGARQKIAGEIFRELDQSLRQDPELRQHVRESIHSLLASMHGDLGAQNTPANATQQAAQRQALARLISSRARAAMPAVARRVVADWTETVLRSTNARRARQSESASRVEVGRGGSPAPVSLRPRAVDYTRMSDEEILDME